MLGWPVGFKDRVLGFVFEGCGCFDCEGGGFCTVSLGD